eukprot:9677783-Prorocentrum_lima.AAC.1
MSFQAPVIPGDVPALLGHRSLKRHRAVVDVVNQKLYLYGPGQVQFTPPPGTSECALKLSP